MVDELRGQKPLTPKQQAIFDAIRASIASRGYPPSMREIGDAAGLSSLSSVSHQLGQLELGGWIRRDPNRPRALEVLVDEPSSDVGGPDIDATTLDGVMDTLDGLRDGGRVVGLVSHVAELRNRIPSQLEVRKARRGSTVRALLADHR